MDELVQRDLFGEIELPTITIDESAARLGVSTATIRNWIKTNYLEQAGRGRVTLGSLKQFESEISGKEKLNQRANKSLKDSHDHEKTTSQFLGKISGSDNVSEKTGIEYEESLSDSYRNKEGIYYTPSTVVRDLFSTRDEEISYSTFCDPCCGSGNFVVRAIELGFRPEHIYGYDIDPIAVEITKARIYKATGYESKNIQVANFLKIASKKEAAKFDCIYTNPPWGKKIAKEERALLGSMLGAGTSVDTCSLFFFACIRSLKENGALGLLLPEAFFNIATFEDARIKVLQFSIERLIDYEKAFKGLVTKAQAIVLRNIVSKHTPRISCEVNGATCKRSTDSFRYNPKSILNFYCDDEDAATLQHILLIPYITLDNKASWGLGIVTGNNNKFVKPTHEKGYIPVYKGADIQTDGLKECSSFIPSNMSLYQQVAPLRLYQAKEKLVYKFISSKLCFFYDDEQRFFLNSANMLMPDESFPVSTKVVAELLSSDFMNWVFSRIFNTHKILRGDLESLPIHSQFLKDVTRFDEEDYLTKLSIAKSENGTYRIKR
ncbi:MAG: TaqI-like C-terminal specificity domain-containing protein [Methylococcaceae bacterium]